MYNPEIHHRRSIRIPDYDYSQRNYYYVTLCTHEKNEFFDSIGRIAISCALSDGGMIAQKLWEEIPLHYPNVELDRFVVMPNHIQGIIIINNKLKSSNTITRQGVRYYAPTNNKMSGSLGAIVRGYKIGVTKWFRKNTDINTVWQRNYYEHIIRNEKSLNKIREYIKYNPINCSHDH